MSRLSTSFCLLTVAAVITLGRQEEPAPSPAPAPQDSGPLDVATLLARDDLRSSFDFVNGRYGGRVEGGELHLEDAQLVFNLLQPNAITVGHARYSHAAVLDLGELRILPAPQVDDQAPKPPLDFFHAITLEGQDVVYAGPLRRRTHLRDAERFLSSPPPEGLRSLAPVVGHSYLLRVRPHGTSDRTDLVVKMLVLDYEAGRFLTFRWARLR